ncbi:MAG: response regulator transcription factor [Clostridia bacterium]|nr:response regulator transcription factor [Clostridia bacterium]
MKLNTIIVDDNKEILESLKKHLSRFDFVNLLYATMDSEDFLEVVLEKKPDLVIMDIDMPRLTGIELGKIIREHLPYIELVYVTSHGEYMREAFEVYASDFLEKPYDHDRLAVTLNRIAKKLQIKEKTIEVKSQKNTYNIRVSEIICIEASKRKSIIYLENDTIEVTSAFNDLLNEIDASFIYKSGRSFAINLVKVEGIQPYSRTSYEIKFQNTDVTALLSKSQYDDFKEQLKSYE